MLLEEGTTQGDNLAMTFYALGLVALPGRLRITTPISTTSLASRRCHWG